MFLVLIYCTIAWCILNSILVNCRQSILLLFIFLSTFLCRDRYRLKCILLVLLFLFLNASHWICDDRTITYVYLGLCHCLTILLIVFRNILFLTFRTVIIFFRLFFCSFILNKHPLLFYGYFACFEILQKKVNPKVVIFNLHCSESLSTHLEQFAFLLGSYRELALYFLANLCEVFIKWIIFVVRAFFRFFIRVTSDTFILVWLKAFELALFIFSLNNILGSQAKNNVKQAKVIALFAEYVWFVLTSNTNELSSSFQDKADAL